MQRDREKQFTYGYLPGTHLLQTLVKPIATRPLALQKDATWYTYGWDLTKNICEVYRHNGTLGTGYTYTPYGQVSASGSVEQPIQWSSEFNDTELGLIYYNYRHYNPVDGRWMGRDLIDVAYLINSYTFVNNHPNIIQDAIGLYPVPMGVNEYLLRDKSDVDMVNVILNGVKCKRIYGLTVEPVPLIDVEILYNVSYSGDKVIISHSDEKHRQKPMIDVYIYRDPYKISNRPHSGYRDRKGRTPLQHEEEHVRIIVEEWNRFVAAADKQLGCYKSISEYNKKHKINITDLFVKYLRNRADRDEKLDKESYR